MCFLLTAEYGDYDSSEHKEDFIQEYQLLPTVRKPGQHTTFLTLLFLSFT